MKISVIVDVMGGDNPASELVRGAVQGARECGASLILVGKRSEIEPELDGFDARIEDTDEVVCMTDDPMVSLRSKSNSSMSLGCRLVAAGEGNIFISCGNTGALYTAASHYIRCYNGIRRAALGAIMPLSSPFVIADAGANPEADANALLRFAKLGETYCRVALKIENPRVALINNGTEPYKGTKIIREAYELLSASDMNFIGNCEGRDLPLGGCDVAVCDGFTGNVAIKTIEGMGRFVRSGVKSIIKTNLKTKIGAMLLQKELKSFIGGLDDTAFGGAPLLGISKPVLKIHGNADSNTVRTAVVQAHDLIKNGLAEKMEEGVASLRKVASET